MWHKLHKQFKEREPCVVWVGPPIDEVNEKSQVIRMEPKTRSVLVIGAGITGAATSALLRAAGISVTVWESSSSIGGRMGTVHAASDQRMHADLGAQCVPVSHLDSHCLSRDCSLPSILAFTIALCQYGQ